MIISLLEVPRFVIDLMNSIARLGRTMPSPGSYNLLDVRKSTRVCLQESMVMLLKSLFTTKEMKIE